MLYYGLGKLKIEEKSIFFYNIYLYINILLINKNYLFINNINF
jgi:hypothetical protein